MELQTGTTGTGNITFNAGTYNSTYGGGLRLWAYGGGTSTGNINFSNVSMNLAGGFSAYAGWDGVALSYNPLFGKGNISISNSTISANGWQVWEAGNDVSVTSSQLTSSAGLIRLSTGGNLLQTGGLINAFSSVQLTAGNDSGVDYQRTLTVGGQVTGYSASLYSGGSLIINGNITANVDYVSAHAGNSYLPSTLTVNGNISSPSSIQLLNDAGSISQASGTISAPTVTIDNEYVATPAGSYVGVNVINGGAVTIASQGPILDNNGTGTTNITATSSISLSSYGGATSGIAISMDTSGTPSSITATVNSGSTYGGIDIRHAGNAPGAVSLQDNSTTPSRNYVEFSVTGNAVLSTGHVFRSNLGGVYLEADGNLTVNGASILGSPSEIALYAGNTLTVNQSFSTSFGGAYYPFIGLIAGSTVNVNASQNSAGNIIVAAGVSKSTFDSIDTAPEPDQIGNYTASTGSTVNINAALNAGDHIGLLGGNINIPYGGSSYPPTTFMPLPKTTSP